MNYLYGENEVLYGILSQFGLTQEMVEDLPVDVFADIYNGRKSPVLPVTVQTEDGESIQAAPDSPLSATTKTRWIFYSIPSLLKRFNEEQKQRLKGNLAIIGFVDDRHRITFDADAPDCCVRSFVQFAPETRQVLSVPVQVIGRNLQLLTDNFGLHAEQMQKM